ncbi:MAG: hypothetical protein WA417_04270 [Stellaceae bacterium]
MSDQNTQDRKSFYFLPGYAEQIAHAANLWAAIEYHINSCIWGLLGTPPGLGACLTSQVYTVNARLDALVALMKVRRVDPKTITKVNKFQSRIREAQDIRNRIVHDMWLNHNIGNHMGRMQITAARELRYTIEVIELTDLKLSVAKIDERRMEFEKIRHSIFSELPSLPEIPKQELHPIEETPWGQ